MKTSMEVILEDIGIQPRDEKGVPRSADDLTKEVMALLDTCDVETASKIYLEITTAGAIESAAKRIKEGY